MKPLDSADSVGIIKQIRLFTHIVSPPVIFAVLGFAVAWTQLPFWQGLAWGTLYGVLISLVPILFVVRLLKTGRITDINMTKQERRIPYFIAGICAVIAAIIIYFGDGPRYLYHLTLLNIIAITGMGAINLVWQISNHATSVVSATWVSAVVFDRDLLAILLPLAIAVCVARIYLRRHTPSQILAGATLGTIAVLGLLLTGCFAG